MRQESYFAKVRRVGNSMAVVVPKDVVEKLELKPGEWVRVVIVKEEI